MSTHQQEQCDRFLALRADTTKLLIVVQISSGFSEVPRATYPTYWASSLVGRLFYSEVLPVLVYVNEAIERNMSIWRRLQRGSPEVPPVGFWSPRPPDVSRQVGWRQLAKCGGATSTSYIVGAAYVAITWYQVRQPIRSGSGNLLPIHSSMIPHFTTPLCTSIAVAPSACMLRMICCVSCVGTTVDNSQLCTSNAP